MIRFLEMWLKELSHNFKHQVSGDSNLNCLWNQDNLYVMDNHRAAAWCWLQACDRDKHYMFLHVDSHSDLLLDSNNLTTYKRILKNAPLPLNDYLELRHDGVNKARAFRWDNYIRPIHYLLPNWFTKAFFAFHQQYDIQRNDMMYSSSNYNGFNDSAMRVSSSGVLDLLEGISTQSELSWIVNIDVDYFFSPNVYTVSPNYIDLFAQRLHNCLKHVHVLTISLSPECCRKHSSRSEGWRNSIGLFNQIKSSVTELSPCIFPSI